MSPRSRPERFPWDGGRWNGGCRTCRSYVPAHELPSIARLLLAHYAGIGACQFSGDYEPLRLRDVDMGCIDHSLLQPSSGRR